MKKVLSIAVFALLSLLAAGGAAVAQPAYPDKPVRLIVPYAPGGGIDLMSRTVGQALGESWGQQVIVENRPGAGAVIGNTAAAKSPNDGYTLLIAANPIAINPVVYENLPYDAKRDFVPIGLMVTSPEVLVVNAASNIHDIAGLLKTARASSGRFNYGSAGSGTLSHLAGESFKQRTDMRAVHVPYKGSAPALQALLAGEVDWLFDSPSGIFAQLKAGKLRALAISRQQRSPQLPDVPTLAEAGYPDQEFLIWIGLMAPTGTPPSIVEKIGRDTARVLNEPAIRSRLVEQGWDVVGNTGSQFGAFLDGQYVKLGAAARAAGIARH